jgi:hypothetical protein
MTIKSNAPRSRDTTPIARLMPLLKNITRVHYCLRRYNSLDRIGAKITSLPVNRTVIQLNWSHTTSGTAVINGRGTFHGHRDQQGGDSHHIKEACQIARDTDICTTVNQTTRRCRRSKSGQVNPCIRMTTTLKTEYPGAGDDSMHTTKRAGTPGRVWKEVRCHRVPTI